MTLCLSGVQDTKKNSPRKSLIQHDGRMNQRGHRELRACYTLILTVRSGSRQVWGISEAPRCSRKLFKTVKPEITQVSLSMPASPASIMAAKSCVVSSGSHLCGQVFSTLRAFSGVSTVVSLGHHSSEAGLTWNSLLKMDCSA